jgi:protein phosphatase
MGHNDFVFAVSDGMGGAHAGEFASRIAVDKITKLLPKAYKTSALGLDAGADDVLVELFDQIHKELLLLGRSYAECAGMGATLTLCWFAPGRVLFAHVGDSRLYYLPAAPGGTMAQVSHDDTHVGWLRRQGKLNEREAKTHPRRNALQKALGAGNQFAEPQIGVVKYEAGDRFLLCTDGLVDDLYDASVQDILGSHIGIGGVAGALIAAALEGTARDNMTAVVVEVGGRT